MTVCGDSTHFKFLTMFVKDMDSTVRFYTELAGLNVIRRFKPGNMEITFMADKEGDTELEFIQPPPGAPLFEGRGIVICFDTDDVERTKQDVIDSGFSPSEIGSHDDGSVFFHVNDPNGMSVEFMQSPKRQ